MTLAATQLRYIEKVRDRRIPLQLIALLVLLVELVLQLRIAGLAWGALSPQAVGQDVWPACQVWLGSPYPRGLLTGVIVGMLWIAGAKDRYWHRIVHALLHRG